MAVADKQKYDYITLGLHAALAIGVVTQLLLSTVMHVPAGRGLGVQDWHRRAFEIHAKVGLLVATVCALHWVWVCLPGSHPGVGSLFPWRRAENRRPILRDVRLLAAGSVSSLGKESPLVGTVHGLGLLAVTGSAIGGIINYEGYFIGAPIPNYVLHWVARWHIAFGYIVATFLIGHVGMAIRHWVRR